MTHNTTRNYPYFGQGTNDKSVSRTNGVSNLYQRPIDDCIYIYVKIGCANCGIFLTSLFRPEREMNWPTRGQTKHDILTLREVRHSHECVITDCVEL